MNGSPSTQSPLARLVLFIACLAFAGLLVGTVHYMLIDMPQHQKALTVPMNWGQSQCEVGCFRYDISACYGECSVKYYGSKDNELWDEYGWDIFRQLAYYMCNTWCDNNVGAQYNACVAECNT
jgi:hypothetical protein